MYFLYTSIYHIFALSFTIIRYHGIEDRDGSSEGALFAGFPATVINTIIVMRACLQGVRSVLLITVLFVAVSSTRCHARQHNMIFNISTQFKRIGIFEGLVPRLRMIVRLHGLQET
jgi:hypothetical protein